MPRPRNDALRTAIADAACSLFHECGYTRASYTLIATRTGISRALVQYHWPRKEALAAEAMRRVLDDALADRPADGADWSTDETVAVAATFYGTLLSDSGWRRFLLDVLASRGLVAHVLPVGVDWMAARMGVPARTADAAGPEGATDGDAFDKAVAEMGGFQELLYRRLREGRYLDAEPWLRRVAGHLTA